MLYQRRVYSAQKTLEALAAEYQKIQAYHEYLCNLRAQLENNKNTAVS